MVNLWRKIRQHDEIKAATSAILKLIDEKRQLENYIKIIDNHLSLTLDRSAQLESDLHAHEDEVAELEQERDYLDKRLAEFEHYKKLSEEWVKEKVDGLTTFEEIEKMVQLADRLSKEKAMIECGWCGEKYETRDQIKQHALSCKNNPVAQRLADFERLANEFVQFKAPDHMCRLRFIHLLNMGKWRQR